MKEKFALGIPKERIQARKLALKVLIQPIKRKRINSRVKK